MMRLMEKHAGVITPSASKGVFEDHYDVIVVGLGTAGSMAAIRAAQRGLKVLGLEKLSCMGGTGTTGGVVGYYYGNRGGVFESIDSQVAAYQRQDDFVPFLGVHSEIKNWVMDSEAMKAGVDVEYESYVIGVYLEGQAVKGLRWVSPKGVHQTSAKFIIDSTGNAEVCELAGCSFDMGREMDGTCQPFSNVQMRLYPNHKVGNFYTDSGYMDISKAEDVTRAIFESNLLGTHLQERYDAESMLLKICQLLGIRESRNIVGEERVTFSDFLEGRVTREPVFQGFSNLDNHGKDMAFESNTQQDWLVAASLFGPCFNVPIPREALIPRGFDGLLAAGRCISLDHDIASAIRQKRDMEKCGETAANMAYLSISEEVPIREISYEQLVELQLETGCMRAGDRPEFKEMTPQESNEELAVPAMKWLNDPQEIKVALSSDKSGFAIWSAKRLGDQMRGTLQEWMGEQDYGLLRKNCALALGLIGDSVCLPVLREMVYSRDLYVPKSSRKFNQPHVFAAIYLLGRLEDQDIMPELLSFIRSEAFIDKMDVDRSNDEFIFDLKELYFQFFSFSMIAAIRIADAFPEWRSQVTELLTKRLADPELELVITLKTHIKEANGFLKKNMNDRVNYIYEKRVQHWI
ncbi:FAD-dependent oxidoreductase [Paenibacillus sp. FSL H7-0326]|uniref:FAD-dependent oxidoreductase n=1 Tax=Paenibacillus sp. FSL H7-0326 TaxID=1921144 RepID=UPI00267A8BB0|nr:FAD-dependent oxidoreductase [Paenibacillus sp. FSL H7-0326]